MPSAFTHIFVGGALGKTFTEEKMPAKFWVLAAVCSIIPDIDIIGFYFGVKYGSMLGHRGFFHSLTFALIVSLLVVLLAYPAIPRFSKKWWSLLAFFFIVTVSHGFLDAMTDKGMGIGFFIPFDNTRYFLPWRPVYASPMSIARFFSHAGIEVLVREILWIWLPSVALCAVASVFRKKLRS
jgi:inner membrane protein